MLRYILFLSLFAITTRSLAQTGNTPAKTTEKPADPQINYELTGSPMPPLRYAVFHDTSTRNKMVLAAALKQKDSVDNAANSSKKKKNKHAENTTADGAKQMLTNEDFDNGANLFIMMFNPNCSHCMEETKMLEKNEALFNRSKVALLASPNMQPYVSDFISYTHVDQYASFMYLGIDSSDFTKKAFVYKALPQINIYNKKRDLVKIFTGDVPIDSLKQYIQ